METVDIEMVTHFLYLGKKYEGVRKLGRLGYLYLYILYAHEREYLHSGAMKTGH